MAKRTKRQFAKDQVVLHRRKRGLTRARVERNLPKKKVRIRYLTDNKWAVVPENELHGVPEWLERVER